MPPDRCWNGAAARSCGTAARCRATLRHGLAGGPGPPPMALLTGRIGAARPRPCGAAAGAYFRPASAFLSFWSSLRAISKGTVPAPPEARVDRYDVTVSPVRTTVTRAAPVFLSDVSSMT